MPLIAQVAWGALFCLPFGFSFLALRLSTAALGALGIIATYFLLRELRATQKIALFGSALLALNPLYFSLSLTFMTDVPFSALSALSLLFFVRALRTDSRSDLLVGYSAAAGALLIRQPAVVIPLAFAIAYVVTHRLRPRSFGYAILPASIELMLAFVYPIVLRHTIGLPANYISARGVWRGLIDAASRDWVRVVATIGDRLLVEVLYLAIFLLPLSIVLTRWSRASVSGWVKSRVLWGPLAIAAAVGGVVLARGRLMPLSGNVLFDFGVGPPLLRDTYLLHLPHFPRAPREFWLALTVISVIGSVPLISRLAAAVLRVGTAAKAGLRTLELQMSFVLIVCIAYLAGTAVATSSPEYEFFDRYLIFVMPPLMVVLVYTRRIPLQRPRPAAFFTAVVVALAYGAFAVGATHDYLAWNRARWRAVDDLLHKGISYKSIDGGFEVNGWYRYDPRHPTKSLRSLWIRGGKYVISFGPVNRYSEVRRYPYSRWMPPGRGKIVVLRRAISREMQRP